MSKGRRITAGTAMLAAERVLEALASIVPDGKTSIAGSLRRGKSMVRDVDIVTTVPLYKKELSAVGEWVSGGRKKVTLKVDGVQVDIVHCRPEEFGAALLYLTGPAEMSIRLRSRAKSKGLKLNRKGLWR